MQSFIARYFAVTFFFCNTVAVAQWNPDPGLNNPIVTSPGIQKYPVMCSDGAGGAIISWYDDRDLSGQYDIYVQRINSSGNVVWALNGIGLASSGMLHTGNESGDDLGITEDGSGGAVIVCISGAGAGDTREIRAQRVDADGDIVWLGNGGFPMVVCNAVQGQFKPRITRASDGFFVAVWQDFRSGTNVDIYAQRMNPSTGVNQWTATGAVVNAALNDQTNAELVSTGINGEVIIAWRDQRQAVGSSDVYAQKMTSAGVRVWVGTDMLLSGRAICTAASNEDKVMICTDGTGGAIISWQDFRNGNADVFAQRVDGTDAGTVQWIANGVGAATGATTQAPDDLCFTSGGAVISYTQRPFGDPVTNDDIYVQKLDVTNGSLLWNASGLLICNATQQQKESSVTTDDSGGVIVCWTDLRNGSATDDIYAQRINSLGAISWATTNGVLVSSAPVTQSLPVIINNGCISIIAWRDGRNGTSDYNIYASSIKCDGTLNGDNFQFRSIATGNWNATSSWEMFNGTAWIPAPQVPNNIDRSVTIRSPHTITISTDMTIDEIIIESGANLQISVSTLTITNSQIADDVLCDGTLTFSGGFISGGGKMTVNGTFNWQIGFLDLPIEINSGGILNKTNNNVQFEDILTLNSGSVMNWSAGSITCDNGSINNSGVINFSGFSLLTASTGTNVFNNLSGGILTVAASSRITFGIPANNQGIFNGAGEYRFVGTNATFTGNGIVQPGTSPGIVTFHFSSGSTPTEMFNNSGNLAIEMLDGTGPGTGHDQLAVVDDIPLVLRGDLTVTETGTVPDGTYTIITLAGASGISGSFTSVNLPPKYLLQVNATNVQVIKNSALPVRLISFTAAKQNDKVLLQWITENEINNSHFEIQRSSDAVNYITIGAVNASLSSLDRKEYSFTDLQPLKGKSYYRLKQVDIDGKFEYSRTARVNFDSKYSIVVSPNPANDIIIIDGAEDFKMIQIISIEGKLVKQFSISSGRQYSVAGMVPGVYILKFVNGKEGITQKLIKQ